MLEDLKRENADLRKELEERSVNLNRESEARLQAQRKAKRVFYLALPLMLVSYILFTIIFAIVFQGGVSQLGRVVKTAFVDGWAFHLTVLTLLAAFLTLPWRRWIGGKDAQE